MLARENFDDQREEKGRNVQILHHSWPVIATLHA